MSGTPDEMSPADHESAVPLDAPVVAATWETREPTDSWCPPELATLLPGLADHVAQHEREEQVRGYGDWMLAGATRRGRAHAHQASFREDSFALHARDDASILVVADGAGSARWSRVGSEMAVRSVVESLSTAMRARDHDMESAMPESVHAACSLLEDTANAVGAHGRDFRTTLIIAVLARQDDAEQLAVCQVGDGCVAVARTNGSVDLLIAGEHGGYSGEVSCFLPDPEAVQRARASVSIIDAKDVDVVLLCTDGIEDPFYPIPRNGSLLVSQLVDGVQEPAPYFTRQVRHGPALGHPEMLTRLRSWLQFERRGENDDRTLAVAYRARAVRVAAG